MEESREIRIMRQMKWYEVVGMLSVIAASYWGEKEKFERFSKAAKEFVEKVESEGLVE